MPPVTRKGMADAQRNLIPTDRLNCAAIKSQSPKRHPSITPTSGKKHMAWLIFSLVHSTGGSGSGKSAYGEKRILEAGEMTRYYIATMEVFGEEGRKKVERHKKLRQGKGFITIESPKDVGRVEKTGNNKLAVLLECVSNLTANEMFGSSFGTELEPGRRTEALAEKICADIAKIDEEADFFAVITNEVGSDGEMYEKETLEYIRLLGLVNCRLAKMASEVVEVVYGIPVMKKGAEV